LAGPNTSFFGLFNTPHWFGPATPFWFTAILSAINVVLLLRLLPETHKHINNKLKMAWGKSIQNIKQAAASPGLRVVFSAEFLFWGGFTFFTTFFQILLIRKLGFSQANIGDFFAYIGICIALTQVTLTPVLAKRFTSAQILRVSLIGNGIALFLQLLPHNTTQLLMVAPFIAIFNGLTIANATALVSSSVGPEIQGEVLGIEASVQALAQSIPAIISGYVATLGVSVPVVVGGATVITGGLMFNFLYKAKNHILHQEV
jgi:DHA1 family tetracycline resistance protein-like MFS transporter